MTYTPTTAEVREAYRWTGDGANQRLIRFRQQDEFDRWLAENNRQVAEAAWDAAARRFYPYSPADFDRFVGSQNPHRIPQPTEGES